jgi:putative tryptophan/tyrosine transport system substrate-binding protein
MHSTTPRRRLRHIGAALACLLTAALILGACGSAQPRVYRVGILSGLSFFSPIADGFKAEMARFGYEEGKNISYDVQVSEVDIESYRRILQGFVAAKVDLIVVLGTEAAQEAKAVTAGTQIPVVFSYVVTDGMNVVESVREPGGNMTGVRLPSVDIARKRYDVLREIAPDARRILMPYLRGYPIVPDQVAALHDEAKVDGVTLVEAPAASPAELEAQLQALGTGDDQGFDAVLLLVEPLALAPGVLDTIGTYADSAKAPVGGILFSGEGFNTVFGVFADLTDAGSKAAPLADKIFRGIPAGTIPVVTADAQLQLNNRKSQELGLTMPEGLLSQAQQIVR